MTGESKTLAELYPWTATAQLQGALRSFTRVLDTKFASLEILREGLESTINVTREVALARINAVLTPIILDTREDVETLAALAQATSLQINDGLTGFEAATTQALADLAATSTATLASLSDTAAARLAQLNTDANALFDALEAQGDAQVASVNTRIDTALAALNTSVGNLQAQVDVILSGGLSADNVVESATRTFVTPDSQAKIDQSAAVSFFLAMTF
jgi:phosphoribosylanthranilate isomerase